MPQLEVRMTPNKGRGVFAAAPIAKGTLLVAAHGWLARTAELDDNWFAMQVDDDLWLCSDGESLDDCINHSCAPNAGYLTGEPTLFALRDIAADEEIAWDYSTSITEAGWSLECRCGSSSCRKIVRPWTELTPAERKRLRPIALHYLRLVE